MIFFRRGLFSILNNHLIDYPTPVNLSYAWGFGSLAGLCLVSQILTGVFLAMHYTPHVDLAFSSVEHIMRDVNFGWFFRYLHANGASFFFFIVYVHIGRTLYFGFYNFSRRWLWLSGIALFFLMMATAFMGYVLPWGQMSFWGATVITNLFTAIPGVGTPLAYWLWGGFSVGNATLNRFFSLHFLLPFLIAGLAGLHLVLLHIQGSYNPLGLIKTGDKVSFLPYFYVKDYFGFLIFASLALAIISYYPDVLGHPDNYIEANALVTPAHIVPEWYFLPFYAILRAVPNKIGGVVLMGLAIGVLAVLPFYRPTFRPMYIASRVLYQWFFWSFAITVIFLGFLGGQPIEEPYTIVSQYLTLYYFIFFFSLVLLEIIINTRLYKHDNFGQTTIITNDIRENLDLLNKTTAFQNTASRSYHSVSGCQIVPPSICAQNIYQSNKANTGINKTAIQFYQQRNRQMHQISLSNGKTKENQINFVNIQMLNTRKTLTGLYYIPRKQRKQTHKFKYPVVTRIPATVTKPPYGLRLFKYKRINVWYKYLSMTRLFTYAGSVWNYRIFEWRRRSAKTLSKFAQRFWFEKGANTFKHPYHLVTPSPWPFLIALSLAGFTVGFVTYFNQIFGGLGTFVIGLVSLVAVMLCWFRDIIREGTFHGDHTAIVQKGLKFGMLLFILSEIMFFFSFFWGFFHSSLVPAVQIGGIWPPQGVEVFNPWQVPLLNTIILLTSGITVTWAHHAATVKMTYRLTPNTKGKITEEFLPLSIMTSSLKHTVAKQERRRRYLPFQPTVESSALVLQQRLAKTYKVANFALTLTNILPVFLIHRRLRRWVRALKHKLNTKIINYYHFRDQIFHVLRTTRHQVLVGLYLTIVLGGVFTMVQYYEYKHATFTISDSVYGATFFLTTGFHGLHVLVGTIMLLVCFWRAFHYHFTDTHFVGFEAAIWYWHFVDVVWLGLYIIIYHWGGIPLN